jgi:low temperature requirement protein LtrA
MAQTTVLLRNRAAANAGRVSFLELFYDLVFVFAITQLSHLLLHRYTPMGAVETALLMLAVWWVWIYTTWALNWLDPRAMPVRLMLYLSMLLGLFMSMSIPEAFGARGLTFALAYAAMQVGRTLFVAWCLAGDVRARYESFQRIAVWLGVSGLFWVFGGLAEGEARLALWGLALGIEYVGPWAYYWVPRLGRSATADWDVLGEHIAERCGLFVIICLGETLLISGATFAEAEWTRIGVTAFVVNFLGTVAMWWLYFHIGQERAMRAIEHASDPGRMARVAFTYAHIPIIAGIVVSAVAAELVIAHPEDLTGVGATASVLGGPALFLLGNIWFKKLTYRWMPLSHLVGLGLTAAAFLAHPWLSLLELSALSIAILIVVAVWERASLGGGLRETTGEPPA